MDLPFQNHVCFLYLSFPKSHVSFRLSFKNYVFHIPYLSIITYISYTLPFQIHVCFLILTFPKSCAFPFLCTFFSCLLKSCMFPGVKLVEFDRDVVLQSPYNWHKNDSCLSHPFCRGYLFEIKSTYRLHSQNI